MKLRFLHCVPTYNNPKSIGVVIKDLLENSPHDILIVDDGSEIPVETLLKEAMENLPFNRLNILRFEKNCGKGVALQRAFKWALENNYTHVVSSDGDGQHPSSAVLKVVEASESNPWSFIIGNRNMNTDHVPDISKFGRKFSNFWVRYQTNTQIADSQSGLRVYPVVHLQNWKFFTKRFDFEIEILIRLIWNDIEILEVPVEVVYHKPGERVSHFDKFWDNLRITFLNTLLIVLSLLREQSSPLRLASAFGVGVFIGCTPFYGFHTLLSAAASFFLKLNFVALFAGNQISLPPLLPFLVPAAIGLGQKLLGHGGALSFLVGTLALGAGLGVIGFLGLWVLLHSRQKKKAKQVAWRGEQRGGKLGNNFLKVLMKLFGLRAAHLCVLFFVVPYFYLFSSKARKASAQYWMTLNPDLGWWATQGKILAHMYRFAGVLLDSVYISMKGASAFKLQSFGYEELKSAVDMGRGVMMLTGHCGSWGVSSRAIGRHGFTAQFHVVRYEGEGLTLSKLQDTALAPKDILVNSQSLPILEIREALQRGGIVSLMGDRPLGNRLELLKFMGKWIVADLSPFRTALACGSVVFYGFGFRKAYGEYFFQVGELSAATTHSDKDLMASDLAQKFFDTLEDFLRKYPDQWFNWYEYFSVDKKLRDQKAT